MDTYGLNVALTNGEVFCREYDNFISVSAAFAKMARNPLCIACEIVGKDDETIKEYVAPHCD